MNDDQQLITRTLDGDMQAFRWLIVRHERLVAHIAGRIIPDQNDLEEVCQDIFLKVYDKLDTFRGESRFSTWVAAIAYRMSINHVNKRRIHKVGIENIGEASTDSGSGLENLESADRQDWLEKALGELPEAQRAVITLFHLQEMSYEEVAEITSMPVGTVKNYLFRGRKKLKEVLEKKLRKNQL